MWRTIALMDKYEHRRLKVLELRDNLCNGNSAELARRIGREPSYVARMIYPEGKTGKKRIADNMVDVIESAFNLPRGWLDAPQNAIRESDADYKVKILQDSVAQGISDAKFVGVVQGDELGFIDDPDRLEVHQSPILQTYTLRVRGEFLNPRIKNGEYIVLNPAKQPDSGDDVLVCLNDGRKMIKELLYIRDEEVTLGSVNNTQKNISIPLIQIAHMHQIVAVVSRGSERVGQ
ncbi:S24 family peptidase [Ferrovum sp.]|uniref:S24 family peptidase n=1 Tax=Ferrovum sp. TaxID=2609467 RepID=UPI00260239B8|nr:S24 family peptidase [Ferrovum sp.]